MITVDNIDPLNTNAFAKSKITDSRAEGSKTAPLSLDTVLQELEAWRNNKAHPNESMPDAIWEKIFALTKQYSLKRIRSFFSISPARYEKKFQELHPSKDAKKTAAAPQPSQPSNVTSLDFCEVKTKNPIFEPLTIPTNTVIAEFSRADGQVMKIHCLSDRFEEIINAFYAGEKHAADNAKT